MVNALTISRARPFKKAHNTRHHAIIATPVNRLAVSPERINAAAAAAAATRCSQRRRTVDLRFVRRTRITRRKLCDALARVSAVAAQESVKKIVDREPSARARVSAHRI